MRPVGTDNPVSTATLGVTFRQIPSGPGYLPLTYNATASHRGKEDPVRSLWLSSTCVTYGPIVSSSSGGNPTSLGDILSGEKG